MVTAAAGGTGGGPDLVTRHVGIAEADPGLTIEATEDAELTLSRPSLMGLMLCNRKLARFFFSSHLTLGNNTMNHKDQKSVCFFSFSIMYRHMLRF